MLAYEKDLKQIKLPGETEHPIFKVCLITIKQSQNPL